jgi:hypothetical protein
MRFRPFSTISVPQPCHRRQPSKRSRHKRFLESAADLRLYAKALIRTIFLAPPIVAP